MRTLNKFVLVGLILLTGCAKVWVKPGASTDDFNRDKYACLQQSQQQVSVLAVGKYSGYGQSSQETNATLYSSCMNSRGWTLRNQQDAASTVSQNQNELELEKARLKSLGAQSCEDKKFASFYAKTSCLATDITLEQLSDKSRATASQKAVMSEIKSNIKEYYVEYSAMCRKYDGKKGALYASYLDADFLPKMEKSYLDLYNGKITWGEFNQKRKDLHNENKAKYREIYAN